MFYKFYQIGSVVKISE